MSRFLPLLLLVTACADPSVPSPAALQLLTTQDLMLNRPNTDRLEARFRMFEGGQGTVEFLNSPDGPQPVTWSLSRGAFCIDADAGLMVAFGCADLALDGRQVTLSHAPTGSVAQGVLVARP